MQSANNTKVRAEDVQGLLKFESVVDNYVTERESDWIAFRRERHRTPEASGQETETSRLILDRLQQLGIEARIPDRGVGVVGDLLLGGATPDTPAIAIRADIDALRMPDETLTSYTSQNAGLAHTCGHDVHTTIAVAVAEILSHLRNHSELELPPCRYRFLFQAAEETCDGARWMIEDGMLENVASILGVHVEPNMLFNQIGIRYGALTAQVDEVSIHIRGWGGHTARPHSTTDPIHAAVQLISQLYQILPRRVDVRDASVFTIGKIQAGSAPNVIPGEAHLAGTLRTIDKECRTTLMDTIQKTCAHISELTGNDIELKFLHPLGSVLNTTRETSAFEFAARQVVGDNGVTLIDRPSMGGEDFAKYQELCAGCQIRLGCATSLPWPHLHSPVFDIDERAIAVGARTVSRTALLLAMIR